MNVPTFSPAARSRRCWSMGSRARACTPVSCTRPEVAAYRSRGKGRATVSVIGPPVNRRGLPFDDISSQVIYRFPVGQLAEAGAADLAAVLFTHLHQDHARGAT